MQLKVSIYRSIHVDNDTLLAAIGYTWKPNSDFGNIPGFSGSFQGFKEHETLTSTDIEMAFKEDFGPLAAGMKFFYLPGNKSIVGMEAMKFEVSEAHQPTAGIILTDLMDEKHVRMLDGALLSELNRYGIYDLEPKDCTWRISYSVEGN